ncbi:LOW QUALITY PROTEIN: pentatricopeptide repeat-containing protein At1g11900 [Benincasa hispida]|uniref:LOW QUALITY PROTEIN: pentatricopeptide repeat-containing protein At1g11900 n=1 Tax=Benincasa hispida TaxID=102211 RepID=UPI00190096D2|nr:LOW QUALITY PROTEIN: pentatricopeptide repeat-containing protein At1g11900 [Benincasa hispida]
MSVYELPVHRNLLHCSYANSIASVPVGNSQFWPLYAIRLLSHQSSSTNICPDEVKVGDEVLNQIIAPRENASRCSHETFDACIDKMCRIGHLAAAAQLLKSLCDGKIPLSSSKAYDMVLLAASESGDTTLLFQVFKDSLVSCKSLSSTSYKSFANAFTRTNDSNKLLEYVKEIIEMTFPNCIVINRIIFAFSKCREIDKALQIFNQMKLLSCRPDLYTYNIILDMLGRAGRVDEILHLFVSMKEDGIAPDIVSYNTLINSFRKVGRLDMCLVYFKEMVAVRIEPDLLTYTALIESFGRSGNIEEAWTLLREMKLKNICPSSYIYKSLIGNSMKMGKVELAMNLLKEMKLSDSKLAGPKDFKRRKS